MAAYGVEKDVNANLNYLDKTETGAAHDYLTQHTSAHSDSANDALIDQFTLEQQKKIMWRIDCRLVLTCGFMYCVSLMDRTNLGLAAIAGMAVDLDLIGSRYSIIVCVL